MANEKVELHPAHTWDCPECGRENFCRGVTIEQTDEAARDMIADALGVEPFEVPDEALQGDWMTAPEEVVCAHCGERFESYGQGEEAPDAD